MYCAKCGSPVGKAKFCSNCGEPTGIPPSEYPIFSSDPFETDPFSSVSYSHAPTYDPVENFNLFTAYARMFKNYANFNGRSRRSEYWYVYLANTIISFIVSLFMIIGSTASLVNAAITDDFSFGGLGVAIIVAWILYAIYSLVIFVPQLALSVRRLHDVGKSGLLLLLHLIPFGIGSIILLIFFVSDSEPRPNKYGPNPKYPHLNT